LIALDPGCVITVVVAFGVDKIEPPAVALKPLIPPADAPVKGVAMTRHVVARRTSRQTTAGRCLTQSPNVLQVNSFLKIPGNLAKAVQNANQICVLCVNHVALRRGSKSRGFTGL
jgi:hypothetical protein